MAVRLIKMHSVKTLSRQSPKSRVGGAVVDAVDLLLDRTLVGYTSVGYRIRKRSWGASDLSRLDGKVAVVTGATAGIGLATAERLAGLGASVWLVGRDNERGKRARARVADRSGNHDVHFGFCDLSSIESICAFAHFIGAMTPRIDLLINNAGVLTHERRTSVDGIELTLATNVIGPFLLTGLLIPPMLESAPARIVNVSSGGMYTRRIKLDDLQSEHEPFDGASVYARTKRAEVILTELWADRLQGTGVTVHGMHPGWVDTAGISQALPGFHRTMRPLLRSADQGADTIAWLAAADEPAGHSGGFWHDRRRRPTHRVPWTRETSQERADLWARCELLSGWPAISTPPSDACGSNSRRP